MRPRIKRLNVCPRLVRQVDDKGCGVACVAMAVGHTYADVREQALTSKTWRASYGMNGAMMAKLMRRYVRPVQAVTMGRQPAGAAGAAMAIVKVRSIRPMPGRKMHAAHWVLWHAGSVYDPCGKVHDSMPSYLRSAAATTGRWHWVQL